MSLHLRILQQGGRFDQVSGYLDDLAAGTRTGFGQAPRFAAAAPLITDDLVRKARVEVQITEAFVGSMDDRDRLGLSIVLLRAVELGRPFTALLSEPEPEDGVPFVALVSYDPSLDRRGGACQVCGCTDDDCRLCIERTGAPCSWWLEPEPFTGEGGLCSACAEVQP